MKPIYGYLIWILILYVFLANAVFAFRHSWMTSTERFIYMKSALMFRKVPINEVRP